MAKRISFQSVISKRDEQVQRTGSFVNDDFFKGVNDYFSRIAAIVARTGRKTVDRDLYVSVANEALKSLSHSQSYKAGVRVMCTSILHANNCYKGYGHNYWFSQGWQQWQDAGCPEGEEKERYIYGPNGKEGAANDITIY